MTGVVCVIIFSITLLSSFSRRFVIYKLPQYKINETGSGLDYMYLDPSVEDWQLSKFLVNMSQGALGETLGQLYQAHKHQVKWSASVLSWSIYKSIWNTIYIYIYTVHNKAVILSQVFGVVMDLLLATDEL